jgi:hypothetical protein
MLFGMNVVLLNVVAPLKVLTLETQIVFGYMFISIFEYCPSIDLTKPFFSSSLPLLLKKQERLSLIIFFSG